jgi:hypothetical protein
MITRTYTLFGAGLAMTLLGGCLGTENPDFNKQGIEAVRFINQLEDLPETAEMPTTGSVEYRGVAAFTYDAPLSDANPGVDLFADMTMTADFDTNSIEGTIDSFNSPNGNVSGTVDVTDGAIVSNIMQANGSGTIVDGDTSTALTLDLTGQFRDEDGSVVTGVISGEYTEGETVGDVFGTFGVDSN